jgi:hypothetical protein
MWNTNLFVVSLLLRFRYFYFKSIAKTRILTVIN